MDKEIKSNYSSCAGCGGNMVFSPADQKLVCEKCGKKTDFPKYAVGEKRPIGELANTQQNLTEWQNENKVLKCASCGASIVLNSLEYASNCPYCGSAMISKSDELPGIPPDGVIPFAFDEKKAAELFRQKVKGKFFVPKAFKKELPTSKIKGIYIPAFTFDASTNSSYVGVLEEDYTVTVNGKTETRTRSFSISGTQALVQKDIMIETSSKINQYQLSQLLPFDHRYTCKYDGNFIRGYVVEHYNQESQNSYAEARKIIDSNIRRAILKKYRYSRVVRLNIQTNYLDQRFLYEICPIYSFEYKYKGKNYITLMNGQTGKIGKGLPFSAAKVWMIVGIVLAVVAAIITVIALSSYGIIGAIN